jgi:hypothetical protein
MRFHGRRRRAHRKGHSLGELHREQWMSEWTRAVSLDGRQQIMSRMSDDSRSSCVDRLRQITYCFRLDDADDGCVAATLQLLGFCRCGREVRYDGFVCISPGFIMRRAMGGSFVCSQWAAHRGRVRCCSRWLAKPREQYCTAGSCWRLRSLTMIIT